ncbi:MAG: hypothetical protein ONB23_08405 [candidate division KSB1 bacterium]|nr:hypothetical protein [candidate division KSB1 bacterium]
MQCVHVRLEPVQPLLLGGGLPSEQERATRQYVAGSVWRGAVARGLLRPRGLWPSQRDTSGMGLPEDLRELFLGPEAARFGYLYPLVAEAGPIQPRDAFPLPLTARTCKAVPGFPSEGGHGIVDVLGAELRRFVAGERGGVRCPHRDCHEPLQRYRKIAAYTDAEDRLSYRTVGLPLRTHVRVGLNRALETAEEGVLYSFTTVQPRAGARAVSFVGTLRIHGTQLQTLRQEMDRHLRKEGGCYSVRLGSARARGHGLARLCLDPSQTAALPPLEQRLDDFQEKLLAGRADDGLLYFAITLRSPLLLLDRQGQPLQGLEEGVLLDYLGPEAQEVEVLQEVSTLEWTLVQGWNAAWLLPKPVVKVLAPGSVLVFRAPRQARNRVIAALERAEARGLGERLEEGMGEVVACHPFHVVFDLSDAGGGG